jgi:hypothetical protein
MIVFSPAPGLDQQHCTGCRQRQQHHCGQYWRQPFRDVVDLHPFGLLASLDGLHLQEACEGAFVPRTCNKEDQGRTGRTQEEQPKMLYCSSATRSLTHFEGWQRHHPLPQPSTDVCTDEVPRHVQAADLLCPRCHLCCGPNVRDRTSNESSTSSRTLMVDKATSTLSFLSTFLSV